jgi:hypothetical protein
VRFEIDAAVGPFELCHCSRCRKTSGAAHVAGLGVRTADFHWISGKEAIRSFEAPIVESPPAFGTAFCPRCGSSVPNPAPDGSWFEIPAGLLDDDPKLRPDRHIFVEFVPDWDSISDGLPQLDKDSLIAHRLAAHRQRKRD